MSNFKEYTIKEYCRDLSSSAAVPGGGGTAALVGALAVSLGNMVGSLTVGKKKYADVETEIEDTIDKGNDLLNRFLELIDEDAKAFEPLSKAYGIPKEDPNRDDIMEEALRMAAFVPSRIVESCNEALDLIEIMAEKGSRLAISDAGCAATLVGAAMEAAALNVYINTKYMKDRDYADKLTEDTKAFVEKGVERSKEIYLRVSNQLTEE